MRILGIDHGERRIGLAVSDPDGIVATALRTVAVKSPADALLAVKTACRETEAVLIVVGLPVNMNGTKGPMAEKVQAFAKSASEATGLPVEVSDERLSTALIERSLLEADMSRAKRKGVRDKLAAQIILQGYLDLRNVRAGEPA